MPKSSGRNLRVSPSRWPAPKVRPAAAALHPGQLRDHPHPGLPWRLIQGMSPGMAIRAVLFDFDGVLVDTEWAIYQSWQRLFEAHGHALPLAIYTRCIGSDFTTWSAKTHLEELTGLGFDWHDLDARRQQEILRDLTGEGPMHGVLEMLEKLTTAGVPCAVVSSSSRTLVTSPLKRSTDSTCR